MEAIAKQAGVWEEAFPVRSYEITPAGTASMVAVCNYLQEAAGNHAAALGVAMDRMIENGMTWVLARQHVLMDAYPHWREVVLVKTWPSGEDGLYGTREFLLFGEGGRPLGKASSAWLVMDMKRRRPVRLPSFVQDLVVPDLPKPIPNPFPRMKASVDAASYSRTFRVRQGDLDLNHHANNVCYVNWALEALPPAYVEDRAPTAVEVSFKAEATWGDDIISLAQAEGEKVLHQLKRASDGKEVALLRTRWPAVDYVADPSK